MKIDYDKNIHGQKMEIADAERQIDIYNNEYIPEVKRKGETDTAVFKDRIRGLKLELQGLNDLFKRVVDKTKRQNDENHKIYDQNALINRLKVKVQK